LPGSESACQAVSPMGGGSSAGGGGGGGNGGNGNGNNGNGNGNGNGGGNGSNGGGNGKGNSGNGNGNAGPNKPYLARNCVAPGSCALRRFPVFLGVVSVSSQRNGGRFVSAIAQPAFIDLPHN
jgi:hypothetical protein